jgi:type IV secretory pathway VirB10-like protein
MQEIRDMASSRSVNRFDDMDPPKPRNDAYTGLLTISFIAMLIGCLLLFIDWYSFEGMSPGKTKDKLTGIKDGGERKAPAPPPHKAAPKVEEPKAAPPEPKDVKKDEKPDAKDMKKDEKPDAKDMKKDDAKKDDAKKDDAKKDDAKEMKKE